MYKKPHTPNSVSRFVSLCYFYSQFQALPFSPPTTPHTGDPGAFDIKIHYYLMKIQFSYFDFRIFSVDKYSPYEFVDILVTENLKVVEKCKIY